MKHMKAGAALLAAGLVLGLGACSAGGDTGGKTELLIWDAGLLTKKTDDGKVDTSKSFLNQAADQYEKDHPDVTIKIVTTAGDISQNSAQFQAASIAGNGPDIRTGYTGGNTLSFSDFLLDLDGTFSDKTMKDLSGWNTVREGYKDDGSLLALPYGGGSYFYVFYDKKKVADAGLDLSTPPATWEDLLADGAKLKAAGQTPFFLANQEGYVGAWVIAALTGGQLGSSAFTDMYNGKIPIDDPAMVKSYEAYAKLFSEGLTNPDAGSVSNADAVAGFVQGKGTFYISGGWDNATISDALGDNVGVFPIPMLEGAKYPDTVAGGPNVAISITNYSKHQEAAKDFLKYLAEPSTIDLYVKLFQVEASNSAQADPSVITNALLKTEAEGLVNTKNVVFPFDNVMPQALIDLFYKVNATTFLGTTTPEDAVSQLQDLAKTELTK
jgi:raffinose/stachyose/melibiose transport system substrate-binding protein